MKLHNIFKENQLYTAIILFSALLLTLCFSKQTFATELATTEVPAITLKFTKQTSSLKATKKYTFETNAPANEVTYSVSNTKYATINSKGVLKGKQVGTVTVTAFYQTQRISCKVKIKGKKTIFLDAGHQSKICKGSEPIGPGSSTKKAKNTIGCSGVSTHIPEYKFTLNLTKKLRTALLKKGYAVVMSRTSNNVCTSNIDRSKMCNKSGADICLRIHADSIDNTSVTGASVLYASSSNPYYIRKFAKKSKKLASKLLTSYCKATKIKKRGIVVRNDLTGTNWNRVPTVLIECGFMSNPSEDRKLNNTKFQKKMVSGMVNGIDSYFGY